MKGLRGSKNIQKEIPSVLTLSGVGKQIAKALARLEIYSIPDLLFHLPLRYQDRTQLQSIQQIIPGSEVVVEGIIKTISTTQHGRTKLLCELSDGTATIHLRFFYLHRFQSNALKSGVRLRCYGEVRLGSLGLEMIHPEYQVLTEGKKVPIDVHLMPIYPSSEGLSQHTLRKLTTNALAWMEKDCFFEELLPKELIKLGFPSLKEALSFIHRPPPDTPIAQLVSFKTMSQQRLIFEELVAYRLGLLNAKRTFQSQSSVSLMTSERLTQVFLNQLPFKLTNAQDQARQVIQQDLAQAQPMVRLLHGDVGSGKTVVAALAMLQAIENGYQAAMMAPTELLAEQHYRVLHQWVEPLGIAVGYLAGNVKGQARKTVLNTIAKGDVSLIVGTHALFQEAVNFSKLALVIIDEQHRFGVHQRALFREKGVQANYQPHQLIMTATPIPRTLAMSVYADLDCSALDELPPGRTPVTTSAMMNGRRHEVIARIRDVCPQGRQAYWVCPLIEESEIIDCQSAVRTSEELQRFCPELNVGLIHGRMKSEAKEAVMRAFQLGTIQLLVATTVIEVGVDVPNASLMIIENAERLGLAQLHQLRGRVGRGAIASHCVLLYQHPLSEVAKERLGVMRETTDGYKIAQRDLELRGPGEVLGTRQTGGLAFHFADLLRDNHLLSDVHQAVDLIMRHYPDRIARLQQRWFGHKSNHSIA